MKRDNYRLKKINLNHGKNKGNSINFIFASLHCHNLTNFTDNIFISMKYTTIQNIYTYTCILSMNTVILFIHNTEHIYIYMHSKHEHCNIIYSKYRTCTHIHAF